MGWWIRIVHLVVLEIDHPFCFARSVAAAPGV
jgi:hypothetical protein